MFASIKSKTKQQPQGFNMLNGIEKIEGLTPEQIESINGLAGGIIDKNKELLDKLSNSKQKASDNESAAERLRALEASLEKKGAEDKENYQKALELQQSEYSRELDQLRESLAQTETVNRKLLVDNAITSELSKLNVHPDLMASIANNISNQAQVTEGQAVVGDTSLSEYMKSWAESPEGKASILAPNNSGVGSNGASNGTGNVDLSKPYNEMSLTEQIAYLKHKGK